MAKIFKQMFIIISLMMITFSACTQDKKVEISENKVTITGRRYYVHIIQEYENLEKISQAYNLSIKEITIENPEILSNWKTGEAIRIPIIAGKNRTLEELENRDEFVYHVVKNDETLYKIAQTYGMEISDLIETNPEAAIEGVRTGEVLRLIKSKVSKTNKLEQNDSKFFLHKIEGKQTLYLISKIYNIDINLLKMVNLHKGAGILEEGTEIKIPKTHKRSKNSNFYRELEANPCESFTYNSEVFKIALMLPFYLNKNDTINKYEYLNMIKKEDEKIYKSSKIILDFYQGVLIAIDSMKQIGFSVDLYVYDTQKNKDKVKEIIEYPEFKNMDLIIGPAYSSNFKMVADFAKENEINIISPLSSKEHFLSYNPFVFQIMPSYQTQLEKYTDFLTNFHNEKIILIHDSIKKEIELVEKYENKLYRFLDNYNIPREEVLIKQMSFNKQKIGDLEDVLSYDMENIIIIPSKNQAFSSEVIRNLIRLSKDYRIKLFGMPEWKNFDNIELSYFHQLNLHYFLPNYVDYDKDLVKNFIKKYRKNFMQEPSNLSFIAYDVMFYFLNMMQQYGKNFQYCLPYYEGSVQKGLSMTIDFQKINEYSGFKNNTASIIRYDSTFHILQVK